MTDPIKTRPLSAHEIKLRERFAEEIAAQPERMDALARQLVTLNLAVPGLYVTALRLLPDPSPVALGLCTYAALLSWGLALGLAILALLPRRRRVDPNRFEGGSEGGEVLGIEAYFSIAARDKQRLLIPGALMSFLGILFAALQLVWG